MTTAKGDSKSKLAPANSVNARHIPLENKSKMEAVLEWLANGEKFDATSRELIKNKAGQGESLGWKPRGSPPKGFEDAAYPLAVSTVDRPAYTNQVVTMRGCVRCIEVC